MKLKMKTMLKKSATVAGLIASLFATRAFAQFGAPATSTSGTSTPPAAAGAPIGTPGGVAGNIARAEAANDAGALVLAYGEATRDPQLARVTLTQLLTDYFRLRALATSAMQASQAVDEAALRFTIFQSAQNQVNVQQNQQLLAQNQKTIEQNDALLKQNEAIIKQNARMIELLDQIARKK